ncbi:MAG: hypothetical protein ACLRY5_10680 [Zhenhengia sp.]
MEKLKINYDGKHIKRNIYILIKQLFLGIITLPMLNLVLIGIPALMIGVIIGGQMAKKMSQQTFMRLSYVLLLISGVSLII